MKAARVSYRVRQLWRAARAQPAPQGRTLAQSILDRPQMELFNRMQPFEQAHSIQVASSLIERGENDPDLLRAALLHDAGKIRCPLQLWERTWIVLGKAFLPDLARKWGAAPADGEKVPVLRRPFIVSEQHPAWGAELALQAGLSPRAADLIRRHQSPASDGEDDHLLRVLQSVDDES